MNVLLTGASGYVGLHLLRGLLDAGHRVTALVRTPGRLGPLAAAPGLTVLQADLEDEARVSSAVVGQSVCVHAALIWGAPRSELEFRDTAVAAKLFDAAGRAGVSRCILLSSTAVHRPFRQLMNEDDSVTTTDVYGATKAAAELVMHAACATYSMSGVVLRPGAVVGPPAFPGGAFRHERHLVQIAEAARAGLPIQVRRREGRQLCPVSLLAQAVVALVQEPRPAPRYLCMSPERTLWEDVARRVVVRLGSPSTVQVTDRQNPVPPPYFRVDRLRTLLRVLRAADAELDAHVDLLFASASPPLPPG